jgi:hypothetical protein
LEGAMVSARAPCLSLQGGALWCQWVLSKLPGPGPDCSTPGPVSRGRGHYTLLPRSTLFSPFTHDQLGSIKDGRDRGG